MVTWHPGKETLSSMTRTSCQTQGIKTPYHATLRSPWQCNGSTGSETKAGCPRHEDFPQPLFHRQSLPCALEPPFPREWHLIMDFPRCDSGIIRHLLQGFT